MNVFLGVTGASGAPYAARLLRALSESGCEVGLAASAAGIEVLATELYGDATTTPRGRGRALHGRRRERDRVRRQRLQEPVRLRLGEGRRVRRLSLLDVDRRHRSGRDGEPDPPRGLGRAEGGRKLVLVPRGHTLSFIHLNGLATLQQAGAVILFAAPGFHGAQSVDDLVDFVVARILDQLGLDNTLVKRWGQA